MEINIERERYDQKRWMDKIEIDTRIAGVSKKERGDKIQRCVEKG